MPLGLFRLSRSSPRSSPKSCLPSSISPPCGRCGSAVKISRARSSFHCNNGPGCGWCMILLVRFIEPGSFETRKAPFRSGRRR